MRYPEFETRITENALAASPAAGREFAIETVGQLARWAAAAIQTELSPAEHALVKDILANLETRPTGELAGQLEALHASMCADDVRAIEFHPILTQLICAVDSFIRFRSTGDLREIADIAIYAVNCVDYRIGGHDGAYSTDNMLGSPLMIAEFERQRRILQGTA